MYIAFSGAAQVAAEEAEAEAARQRQQDEADAMEAEADMLLSNSYESQSLSSDS